jgi:RNA-directed DNA polymerase
MNPTGGADDRREDTQPALHSPLLNLIVSKDNVTLAWKQVKRNKGAPGIDGISLEAFPAYAREHWPEIQQSLLDGTYVPQPLRQVKIPKPDGGERMLGIPTIQDRVIQQAIAQIMMPIFDPHFSDSSFGFRPKRSAHGALKQVKATINAGYRIAVDLDLAKFFDNVHHDVLMSRIARKIKDKTVLALIGRYLRAGIQVGQTIQPTKVGTPQGSPLSPLLANILLNDLDKELETRGHRFARYADDVMILVKSQRAGERVKVSVTRYLTRKLKLPVNEKKSRVAPVKECSFLGFTFIRNKLRWTNKALEDFKYRIRQLTGRSWGVSMTYRLRKLAEYIQGWMGYFGISEYYRPIPELDEWLRRRVRMCYWKQWRRCSTKIRNLLQMGVFKRVAILTAVSSKGYWHLSRSLATQTGMTNTWLRERGLISIRDCWMKAQGYT